MQQSHPNLVTFNQIENYNTSGSTSNSGMGAHTGSKRGI